MPKRTRTEPSGPFAGPTRARGAAPRRRARAADPEQRIGLRDMAEPFGRLGAAIWRRRVRLALGAAVFGGLFVGFAALVGSGLTDIRGVKVEGAHLLNDRILAEDSGLRGKSILTADLGAAEQHLESNPLIADVHIERDWPLDVRIIVTERQAWAVWQTERERYVVDKDGFVLEGIDPPIGAPVIIDAREQNGEPFTRGIADIVTTVYNLRDFMPSVVGMEPRGFRLEDDRGLVVSASDGHVAVFGDGHDFDYKLAAWKALLDAAEAGDFPSAWAEVVDLRFGDRPSLVRAIGAIEEQEPGAEAEAGVGEESPVAEEAPLDEALPEEAEPAAEEPPVSDVGADATAPLPDGTTGVVEAAEPPPGLQPADPASGVE